MPTRRKQRMYLSLSQNTPRVSAPRQLPYLVGLLCGDSALALLHLRGLRRLLRLPGGLVVVAVLLRASLRTPAKRRPAPSRAAAAGLGVRAVRTTARPTSHIAVRTKEERRVLRVLRVAHRLLLLAHGRRGLGAALPACRARTRTGSLSAMAHGRGRGGDGRPAPFADGSAAPKQPGSQGRGPGPASGHRAGRVSLRPLLACAAYIHCTNESESASEGCSTWLGYRSGLGLGPGLLELGSRLGAAPSD